MTLLERIKAEYEDYLEEKWAQYRDPANWHMEGRGEIEPSIERKPEGERVEGYSIIEADGEEVKNER